MGVRAFVRSIGIGQICSQVERDSGRKSNRGSKKGDPGGGDRQEGGVELDSSSYCGMLYHPLLIVIFLCVCVLRAYIQTMTATTTRNKSSPAFSLFFYSSPSHALFPPFFSYFFIHFTHTYFSFLSIASRFFTHSTPLKTPLRFSMHVVTKLSPRTKNASASSQGEAESEPSAPTINTSSEQDGPVWRDPLENPSFITTSPTTTMSQEDLYPNSLSMALQSPLPFTDRRSFASQLEASLLASNLTAATTTLNSSTSSSSSRDLRSTIGNNNVTTTNTAESNSKEDSKRDLHSEETKPTAPAPSNSSEPTEEDKRSRTSTDKPRHAHSHSHSHSRDSSVHSPPPIVKETLDACITVSPTGMLQVKQYELRRIIGQGAFGIVNLGVDVNTGIKYVRLFVCFIKTRDGDKVN